VISFIDFSDPRDAGAQRLRHAFGAPRQVLAAHALHEVRPVVEAAEAAARAGAWVLGWLCYEAAAAFDPALVVHAPEEGAALAWFAVHDAPGAWPQARAEGAAVIDWHGQPALAAFEQALAHIQQGIAAGAYYQVNFTAPLHGRFEGDAAALFAALQRA